MLSVTTSRPVLLKLLRSHSRVSQAEMGTADGLEFLDEGPVRSISVDDPSVSLFGLPELIDNNPLVCADRFAVPSAEGTLALIALGPLAQAGLIEERPNVILSWNADEPSIERALESAGWNGGVNLHCEPQELGTVRVATAMIAVPTPEDPEEIGELYDERFGRSFYIRQVGPGQWDPDLVRDTHFAAYRLTLAEDQPQSLLTIRVMADANGKCGSAQILQAMNTMCGFEETQGIG
jgi:N-acetyl-gamma-glutamylphosphate reductase